MKKIVFIIICLSNLIVFSQTIVVPNQLSAQRSEEDYQLKTFLKFALEKRGFMSVLESGLTKEQLNKPCDYYYTDVVEESKMLSTRLKIIVFDCKKQIFGESDFGVSKEKEYKKAYQLAFREAEKSLMINRDKTRLSDIKIKQKPLFVSEENTKMEPEKATALYAQPIVNGFQLINEKPEIICKIFKTSQPKTFIAEKFEFFGIGHLENNQLTIEYYKENILVKEILIVKF